MIVTEEPAVLTLPEPRSIRPMGLHQSAIIRCVATEYGILKPEWCEELSLADIRTVTDPMAILRMSIGLAWEEYYIPMLPDVEDHPDTVKYDGVYMSMDGLSLSVILTSNDGGKSFKRQWAIVVHEVKATYKSVKTVGLFETKDQLRKNWMWLAQLKTYCIAKKTRFASLHVLFLCGDYKFPIQPQLKKFNFEFTNEELQENWTFLREYATLKLQGEI